MRGHRKLTAFEVADQLILDVYCLTATLPPGEEFGLKSQMRRAAVSIATNIVEGCARSSLRDYLRFLSISLGSAKELAYLLDVGQRLDMLRGPVVDSAGSSCESCIRLLARLRQGLESAMRRAS